MSRKYWSVIAHPCYKNIQIQFVNRGMRKRAPQPNRGWILRSLHILVLVPQKSLCRGEQSREISHRISSDWRLGCSLGDRHWGTDPSSLVTKAEIWTVIWQVCSLHSQDQGYVFPVSHFPFLNNPGLIPISELRKKSVCTNNSVSCRVPCHSEQVIAVTFTWITKSIQPKIFV